MSIEYLFRVEFPDGTKYDVSKPYSEKSVAHICNIPTKITFPNGDTSGIDLSYDRLAKKIERIPPRWSDNKGLDKKQWEAHLEFLGAVFPLYFGGVQKDLLSPYPNK